MIGKANVDSDILEIGKFSLHAQRFVEAKIFPAASLEQCRLAAATSSMAVGRLLRRQVFRLLGEPDQRTSVDVMLPSRRTEWIDRACRLISASIITLLVLPSSSST